MGSAQTNQALFRLALEQALFRGFDAVIDGVAQQMSQRCFKLFQHVAIDLGFLAFDLQAHLFAKAAPEVANHARLPAEHVGERAHATGQRGVIEHLRALTGLPGEFVEFGVFLAEQLLRLGEQTSRIFQRLERFQAQRMLLQVHIEIFQCAQAVVLHAFEALHGRQVRLETLGFHQRFARQIEQAVQALGGDAQDALAALGGAFVFTRGRLGGLVHDRRCRCWRGLDLQLGHWRRGNHSGWRRRIEQTPHQRHVGFNVRRLRRVGRRGDAHQQIGALQQRVDVLGTQQQTAFLGADQAIFHDVGDADAAVDTNDPRRTFERVRRAHARLQLIGLGRIALQRQQPGAEHLGLGFGFEAEQFEQGGVAHLLGGHVRLRVTADNSCSSSSQRRLRPRYCRTPRVYLALACAPD